MNPHIKFTKEDAELAAKVANDIAEDIDNKETRAQLRRCVEYWAWQYTMMSVVHSNTVNKVSVDVLGLLTETMKKTLEERYWGEEPK